MIDNLLDLSHLAFLHASRVRQAQLAGKVEAATDVADHGVRVSRWTLDVRAVETYLQFGKFRSHIDRWQISKFIAPSFFVFDNGAAAAGTGGREGGGEDADSSGGVRHEKTCGTRICGSSAGRA